MTETDFPAGSPQRPKQQGLLLMALLPIAQALAGVSPSPVFPLHVLKINDHAFAAVPAEPTAIAAWRLEQQVKQVTGVPGCTVLGYSSDYCGYLTTPEEYDAQQYEGSSTLWGRNTVPFLCAAMKHLLSAPPVPTIARSVTFETGTTVNLFNPPVAADPVPPTPKPTISRKRQVIEVAWTMPRSFNVLFAEGWFVRVQVFAASGASSGAWQDLLVDGWPIDDVERLVEIERIDPPFAALQALYGWRALILLPESVSASARLRVVAQPRTGFSGFIAEVPDA